MRSNKSSWRSLAFAGACIAAMAGTLSLFSAQNKPDDFGGLERYTTHVSTDKPLYRPGETVYLRSVHLHAFSRIPLKGETWAKAKVQNSRGATVMETNLQIKDASGGAAWQIPANIPGGEYTISVTLPGYAPAERKFDIRAYRAPRLKTHLEFLRKGYGPGDKVSLVATAKRAEGGVPENAKVTAVARIDGAEVWRGETKVDARGRCSVSFDLPVNIEEGVGSLTLVYEDGGVVESASKTLPILLQKIPMTLCPEGGDLVAGLECGLYVEALTPWGDPADMTCEVVDKSGAKVAEFATQHEGRAYVRFTPQATPYFVKVVKPAGVSHLTPLPEVKAQGVSLRATQAVLNSGEAVGLHVATTKSGTYRLMLSQREKEVSSVRVDLKAGEPQTLFLTPESGVSGVLRATLFDTDGKPLAERLVFRRSTQQLNIEVSAPTDSVPGEKVEVVVRTSNAKGEPVSAVVGLTVTDDAVLEMIEKRQQAPRLPAMVLLEQEVDHLEDAHFYLNDDPRSAAALDLLLGTQGWRRFAYADPTTFAATRGDKAKRMFAKLEPIPDVGMFEEERAGAGGGGRVRRDNARPAEADGAKGEPPPVAAPRAQEAPPVENEAKRKFEEEDEVADAKRPSDEPMGDMDERPRRKARASYVREYAHKLRDNRKPNDRVDFTETLYWNAGVRTDKDGLAKVSFWLNDSVTSFRIRADGFTDTGALGQGDALINSRQPFYLEPKLPLEVTAGDLILLPVSLVNYTKGGMKVVLEAKGGEAISLPENFRGNIDLKRDERGRLLLPVRVGRANGKVTLTLDGQAGAFSDKVTREFTVKPLGFPMSFTSGGMLDAPQSITFTIPADVHRTSITTSAKVYPTPAANLMQAMEALIREPYGCFEQTSSTSYPLVMAQQYFMTHTGVDPALISRANEMIEKSYQRLTSFECKEGGYEWFGQGKGHESLTAYGVLQFTDMAKVYPVDAVMLKRTRDWLLSRKDGKGGFEINPRFLHTWGCPKHIADAYIVWSLTESGETGLNAEVEAQFKDAVERDDPYYNGLVAMSLMNVGRKADALKLIARLAKHQQPDGSVVDSKTTVVESQGDALRIETTAVCALAWLRDKEYAGHVEKAMQWVTTRCKNGCYASTQATVLALKAIVAYDASRAKPKADGAVVLWVDGKEWAKVPFTKETTGTIDLPDFAEGLSPGAHKVELRMVDGSPMPFSLDVRFYTTKPDNDANCALDLAVALASGEVKEGESTEVRVKLTNTDKTAGKSNAMTIVGLPGGLEVRHEKLKELVKQGVINAYETRGRDVVFYVTTLQPGQSIEFSFDAIAAVPGEYRGQASRAYLYYADEYRKWVEGLAVKIAPRQ